MASSAKYFDSDFEWQLSSVGIYIIAQYEGQGISQETGAVYANTCGLIENLCYLSIILYLGISLDSLISEFERKFDARASNMPDPMEVAMSKIGHIALWKKLNMFIKRHFVWDEI